MEDEARPARNDEADRDQPRQAPVVDRRERPAPSTDEEIQLGGGQDLLSRHHAMMHPVGDGRPIDPAWNADARTHVLRRWLRRGRASSPTRTHDLADPWQARPFAVDPALIEAGEKICRDLARNMVQPILPLVLVDARGDNRLLLLFAGPADISECFLTRDRAGQLAWDSGAGSDGGPEPPLRPTEVRFIGAGSADHPIHPTSHGVGRVGIAMSSVELRPPSGVVVQASLNRGLFAAWWYGLDQDTVIVVRGYDATGRLVGTSP
jgi:hypothetical protein